MRRIRVVERIGNENDNGLGNTNSADYYSSGSASIDVEKDGMVSNAVMLATV